MCQEELAALDVERESLLDVVMAKARQLGVEEKIQRVLIALTYAKASDSGSDLGKELAATISQMEAEDEQGGTITGISMLMPGVCLAQIEGPQRLIVGTLRALQQPNGRMKQLSASIHMFLSVQDTPGRCFDAYFTSPVKIDAAGASGVDVEQAVNMIPEMSVNILKLGRELSEMDRGMRDDATENLKKKMGDTLPRIQDVLGLTQCNDILTLEDFFDLYYSPAKCLGGPLDSEVVWPLPPSLNF